MTNINNLGYTESNDTYTEPYIIKNLLSVDECNKIIAHCSNKLIESEVVSGKDTTVRNSQQTWIIKNDPLITDTINKIIQNVNKPLENAEDLQIVRYRPGQYYNEHHDSCCDDNDHCKEFIKRGGQRVLTVLIYLNDGFTDGETFFKNLNLKIKPQIGDAIVFYPLATNINKCHPKALHAGLPVSNGEKWIANLWFRESKFI
jgi:prolyl 4-hydroxylase